MAKKKGRSSGAWKGFSGSNVSAGTGMTRTDFLRTAGVAAAGFGAAAVGLGGVAKAHPNPDTTYNDSRDYYHECSYPDGTKYECPLPDENGYLHQHLFRDDVYDDMVHSSGGYLTLQCGSPAKKVSPILDVKDGEGKVVPYGQLYPWTSAPSEFTGPQGFWVRTTGDAILVANDYEAAGLSFATLCYMDGGEFIRVAVGDYEHPNYYDVYDNFGTPYFADTAYWFHGVEPNLWPKPLYRIKQEDPLNPGHLWPTDPVHGYTSERVKLFWNVNKGSWLVLPPGYPVPFTRFGDIAFGLGSLSLAGFPGFLEHTREFPEIDSIVDLPRPGDSIYGGEDIQALESQTYSFEFTVPASYLQEHVIKPMVANGILEFVKGTLVTEIIALWTMECEYDPTSYPFCPYLLDPSWPEMCLVLEYAKEAAANLAPGVFEDMATMYDPGLLKGIKYYEGLGAYDIDPESPPPTEYKMRGWFIPGAGVYHPGENRTLRPLVILNVCHRHSAFGTFEPPKAIRRLAHALVTQGHTVVLHEFEGFDFSDGWNLVHDYTAAGYHSIKHPLLDQIYLKFTPDPENPEQVAEHPYYGAVYLDGTPVPDFDLNICRENQECVELMIPEPFATGNSVNIFHMINQLAGSPKCTVFHPDEYPEPQTNVSLISSAADTPVILYGSSHGSMLAMRSMHLWLSEMNQLGHGFTKSDFNLRGVIESDGLSGSVKYIDAPANRACQRSWTAVAGILEDLFHTQWLVTGEIFDSISKYCPGWMSVKGIHDDFGTLDGVVDLFNRCRGFKEITTVWGTHGWTLYEPNFSYVTQEILKFCKKVTISRPPMNNNAKTTLQKEACKAPEVDLQAMWDHYVEHLGEPPEPDFGFLAGKMSALNAKIKKYLRENPPPAPQP